MFGKYAKFSEIGHKVQLFKILKQFLGSQIQSEVLIQRDGSPQEVIMTQELSVIV